MSWLTKYRHQYISRPVMRLMKQQLPPISTDRTGRAGQWQRLVGFRTFFRQAGLVPFTRFIHQQADR